MKTNYLLLFLILLSSTLNAQDDLLDLLEQQEEPSTQYTYATFKGTRLINGHSIETVNQKELQFLISHRFGRINSGAHEFWGLDGAFIRLGLEYGLTDQLDIGVGRSSFDKTYDFFLKYKILRQSKGVRNMPVTVTGLFSTTVKTTPREDDDPTIDFQDRLGYAYEILIARKFSEKVSLQIMPATVHRNRIDESRFEKNDLYALGAGGRVKITKSVAINAEYYYRFNADDNSRNFNPVSLGVDIETGGHVFQLHVTNTRGMVERSIIAETTGDIGEGDIHFGFNIARTFNLGGKRTRSEW